MNIIDNGISMQLLTSTGCDISNEILNEGSMILIKKDFKSRNIPAGEYWRWNQVKSRYKVLLPITRLWVEFYKLLPRSVDKKEKTPKTPFKIWRFDVFESDSNKVKFRILWCEKGIKDKDKLLLEDLKFLSRFMEPNIVDEIWPSK